MLHFIRTCPCTQKLDTDVDEILRDRQTLGQKAVTRINKTLLYGFAETQLPATGKPAEAPYELSRRVLKDCMGLEAKTIEAVETEAVHEMKRQSLVGLMDADEQDKRRPAFMAIVWLSRELRALCIRQATIHSAIRERLAPLAIAGRSEADVWRLAVRLRNGYSQMILEVLAAGCASGRFKSRFKSVGDVYHQRFGVPSPSSLTWSLPIANKCCRVCETARRET